MIEPLGQPEALPIPGIGLPQPPAGALHSEMLLGPLDYPVELGDYLFSRGIAIAVAQDLLEDPGVAERPARQQDGGHAGLLVGLARLLRGRQAAGQEDRGGQRLGELTGQLVVRLPLVLLGGVARVEPDPGHARVLDQAAGDLEAAPVARHEPRAQLDGYRQPAPLYRRARDGDGLLRVLEKGGAGAGLHDLLDRAAHVDVDQVGAGLTGLLGGDLHHLRVVAEELDRDRVLVGVDAQEFAQRALVAVLDPEARDHLGHGKASTLAARLHSDEPVADARQRRQDRTVREADASELPGLVDHASQARRGRWDARRRRRPWVLRAASGAVALPDEAQPRQG